MVATVSLLGVIFSTIIFILLRWTFRRYRSLQLIKRYGIPGPKPEFFAGNLYHLKKESTPHGIMKSWLNKYGDVFGYYMGGEPYVVIRDLEMLKMIMIKDFNQFSNRPKIMLDFGPFPKTLVGLRDKRWKEVRNIITPMFSSGKMKLMTDIISRKVDITVDLVLKKAKSGEMFNIYSMTQGLTLDVIAACALAMKTQCQENENDVLLLAVRDMVRFQFNKATQYGVIFPSLARIIYHIDVFTPFGKAINLMVNHLKNVVEERSKNSDIRSFDILQTLLEHSDNSQTEKESKLTLDEVVCNAFVVFLAGYETTATSLAFTLYLLVKHPEVQQRLYEEIQNAKDSSYETLQSLQYLDQVFSESLRLYPPVPDFVSRTCSQDYKIGSFTIPKGSHVQAPIWDIHHDPDLWPDPWKFDPERFSPANKSSIKNMSYMPFGVGPRNCVGIRFAQLEAKMILFKLLKNAKLIACEKTEHNLTLVSQFVLTLPGNGVWIKAIPRE